MTKVSWCAEVKEYLCERTSNDAGLTRSGKDKRISRCCIEAFLSGALLFSKKYSLADRTLTVDSAPFSELLTYIFINNMHFVTSVTQKTYRSRELFEVRVEGREAEKFFSRFAESFDLSDLITCEECAQYFLRGVFLACGTVTSPDISYHAEFIAPSEELAGALYSYFLVEGREARLIKRRNNHVVYIKGSERLSDLFTEIGATPYAFDVIEKSIEKETRNNINRSCNCENANTKRTVSAFLEFKMAVEKIKGRGEWNSLSKELREAAELRLAYPDASLSELCLYSEAGTISRSGLNHRLKKIIEIAKEND